MDNNIFKKEKENLKNIIEKYEEVMEYYKLRLEAIPKLYSTSPIMIDNFTKMYSAKIKLMEKSINKPYFARIDFERDGEEKIEKLYIGKVGVMDEENNNITIDWRAPVSSMYYDSNIGRASYIAPEGICTGNLLLKRQYDIEERELKSFQDVDTVSNDELLKPYLATNSDNRLKNIVSTIQQEQNQIIRMPISKNIIIQGVAGSGKTTVALHRIAYLVYNYRDSIKPNQYMVIGPNKFFVNYISGVLPDLDVDDVKQLTYDELCSEYLNEKLTLIDEDKKLIHSITNEEELEYEKYKVSMEFKKALDKYIEKFQENIIPADGIKIKGYDVIPGKIIRKAYNTIEDSIVYDSVKKKIDRTNLILEKSIEDSQDTLVLYVRKQFKRNFNNVSTKIKNEELDKINSIEKEIRSGLKTRRNKYFNGLIPNILNIYIDFLSNLAEYIDNDLYARVENKIKKNIKNVKTKKVEFEDLSALIYLKTKIIGIEEYKDYRQVAIDEAQDLGDFSFYALKNLLRNSTFSIFGDLAQSIYQYRGIKDWKNVTKETFNENCEMQYLLKSYRTTMEIMNSANNITKYIGLNTAKPVIRHGNEVYYTNFRNENEQIDIIKEIIEKYKEKQYKTVAVICKSETETLKINKELRDKEVEIKNITDSDTQYTGGICTIPSYLAKGLEFDGVIITDASEKKYSSNKSIDMKLLYVGMTRPLHELNVLYNSDIVKPLQEEIK